MEFHMIDITYAALHMRAQTENTTFSCKDDCTLTKHTRCWTYFALFFINKKETLGNLTKGNPTLTVFRKKVGSLLWCWLLSCRHFSFFWIYIESGLTRWQIDIKALPKIYKSNLKIFKIWNDVTQHFLVRKILFVEIMVF